MKKFLELFVLVMVLALVNPASAIERASKFAIGGYAGYAFGFGDVFKEYEFSGVKYQNKATFSFGAKAKYGVTSNLALVGAFDYQGAKWEAEGTFEYDGESYPVSESESYHWIGVLANGMYIFSPGAKTSPYVTAGGGFYIPDEGDSKPGINAGIGVEHSFQDNLALDAGARFHMIFTEYENTNYVQIHLGLTAYLGAKVAEVEKPPTKPPVYQPPFPEKPKYPADIVISNIHFFEPSGNQILDGYETAKLLFTVANQGKGEAVGVKVELVPLLGGSKLSFERETEVGMIEPNSSKSIEIPITAPYDVPSEEVKFRVEISEEYGNDADPVAYSFETRAYQPPKLEIANLGIDDDKEGDSQGDNDGIIEPGEAVEVTCAVQNTGLGDAKDVTAKMVIADENVHYMGKEEFDIGDIPSGVYKTLEFYFWIPKKYNGDNVPISVQLTELKGRYGVTEPLNLPVGTPSGYMKEITVTRKESEKSTKVIESQLSVDVEVSPQNSLTKLENGLCIIFGIEDYKYAPKASFANRDAAIFYEYAKSVFGLPERNIYIRTNEGATKGEFDKIFAEDGWLAKRVVKGKSDVIFYFSGHGAPDIKTKKPYLIPYDIDPNYASTAFSLERIYQSLSSLGARSVTIFLDACFSGQSRGEVLFADARPLMPVSIEAPSADITVFSASTGEQISSVYSDKKHGLFTYYLLRGLQGYGDLNGDKEIRVGELSEYLKENVSKEAGFMDKEQVPQLLSGDRERVLLRVKR